MKNTAVTENIRYVGVNDKTIDLFESQYRVPKGVSYNSYVIMDEKTAVMDSVDIRAKEEWFTNLKQVLSDRQPDYLIVSHMEPDHAGSIQYFMEQYPDARIVASAKALNMMPQFFSMNMEGRSITATEGTELVLGKHVLTFVMAPMVHWPEVMVTYEKTEKILFSADAFGKFGALDVEEDWICEARRYYFNIVGKYGAQVQALLKKAASLDIRMICPLHGPVLKESGEEDALFKIGPLQYYMDLYQAWGGYKPEKQGVFIACASIYGNTLRAAEKLAELLQKEGMKEVRVMDLAREDMAEAVEAAFCYDRLVLASVTYDGGLFPCMEDFLARLKAKNYQKRTVGMIENGSWAPMSGRHMKEMFAGMKEIIVLEPVVTVKSALNGESEEQIAKLAQALLAGTA
ncbi:MAG: FprA family A-type flavoprotein [Lachnoclostridium sp.]|nr:FprA family A-type flavoprotein [Lachnospira sp.]MCM1247506.1 FprA family A-type flavoprotein [Lachnoclostridium sp.]MCM1535617.1 FprA family A-type flavoprotein [Clostridium sp.]